jgi:indolepyruvate ferredoxin oxidoreductase beta subunit
MAQRGGCVVSHVRIGDEIHSPLIPKGGADVILGFEPGEAVRCLPYLKPEGTLIVNTRAVKPVTATLGGSRYEGSDMLAYLRTKVKNLILVDGEDICERCGSPKVLNTALVAAGARAGCLDISIDELKSAIRSKMKEKYHAPNLMAVEILRQEME